jgi:putative holliday junction resolvase
MARVRRAMAIDLGKARAGVAVADELGMMAHSRGFLEAKSRKVLLQRIAAMAKEDAIERLLVGLPLEMTGEEGPAARRAVAFAQELADVTGLDVELVDERLSTVEATQQLRASGIGAREGKGLVDGVAATVILQRWLDGQRSGARRRES